MARNAPTAKRRDLVAEQAAIKAAMLSAGITLAMIDKDNGFADGTARNAMREPNAKGERAIAAALSKPAHHLWPSRYDQGGTRREPQNYERVPTYSQRRNGKEALT